MDDVPLCPPWWPSILWWLHHPPPGLVPHHGGDGSPVNYPPEINRVLLALVSYSGSYHIAHAAGVKLREAAKAEVVAAANSLSTER